METATETATEAREANNETNSSSAIRLSWVQSTVQRWPKRQLHVKFSDSAVASGYVQTARNLVTHLPSRWRRSTDARRLLAPADAD